MSLVYKTPWYCYLLYTFDILWKRTIDVYQSRIYSWKSEHSSVNGHILSDH